MKRIALMTAIIFGFVTTAYAGGYECLNLKGKLSKCDVWVKDGVLHMEYQKKAAKLNKEILGKKITNITGGEYARRRVAESLTAGIIFAPIALFGLFSKKKRDTFAIEFIDKSGNADATMIQMKKKYSPALAAKLQAISGKKIVYEEKVKKK